MVECPKCGFKAKKGKQEKNATTKQENKKTTTGSDASLKVMEGDSVEALPTTNIECPQCGNGTAFWWMLQTRSADEATTQFYRCTKCSHTWRNYA
ncbi:putative DNA-directed RNA polymerase subunit M [Candidatus Nitrososphaera gargensis Ga9.2]|uniref:Putative DNA-directed RNA polymerase subunit M n=2 Tax=Candidatus Nitrososphaera gargensis TaxID=497727 RepID=K0IHM2_NITGG|nr:putative DNA-directed RNA polymerase subunit M [Candidatus Nitrososphaera gargensis Ga9.2]